MIHRQPTNEFNLVSRRNFGRCLFRISAFLSAITRACGTIATYCPYPFGLASPQGVIRHTWSHVRLSRDVSPGLQFVPFSDKSIGGGVARYGQAARMRKEWLLIGPSELSRFLLGFVHQLIVKSLTARDAAAFQVAHRPYAYAPRHTHFAFIARHSVKKCRLTPIFHFPIASRLSPLAIT